MGHSAILEIKQSWDKITNTAFYKYINLSPLKSTCKNMYKSELL
jgi:hypothetical protein